MALDVVKEWLYGCTHCGTCKDVLNIFVPACPAGERYQVGSYFPSGRISWPGELPKVRYHSLTMISVTGSMLVPGAFPASNSAVFVATSIFSR